MFSHPENEVESTVNFFMTESEHDLYQNRSKMQKGAPYYSSNGVSTLGRIRLAKDKQVEILNKRKQDSAILGSAS